MNTYRRTPAAAAAILAAAAGTVLLGGCATFSRDAGFGDVESVARERLDKKINWIRSEADATNVRTAVMDLLRTELSVDDAVQIALLNNPGLQAAYAELGIAEADLVQAGRMSNPHLSYLRTRDGGERKFEWALTFPIIDLLTLPLRRKIEGRRFEAAKLGVAARVVEVAAESRRAYFRAVAAEELVRYVEQVKTASEASAELARGMARAGNWSRLSEMREQAFHAEVVARLARARHAALGERERLVRLMGLAQGDARFTLAARLPELPAGDPEYKDLEAKAMAQRLDIQMAKRETESLAESLGLTKATRFVNVFELGPAGTKEDPEPWKRGFEVSLQVPIFDWGEARVARAETTYMQSARRLAESAVNAHSELREAHSAYRAAREAAMLYRDEVVPLRKKISEENLLRYNGMLVSVFDLLADAREQIAAVTGYIEALRDFWLAETDLRAAVNGPSPARRTDPFNAARGVVRAQAGGH